MNVLISVGACIVIIGALGKILHSSWGTVAITAGMLTECFIFLLMAFVPVEAHPHWDRYFPDIYKDTHKEKKQGPLSFQQVSFLNAGAEGYSEAGGETQPFSGDVQDPQQRAGSSGNLALDKLDDMLQEAEISPKSLKKLGDNFSKLNTTVTQISDLSEVQLGVQDFALHTKEANEALENLKKTYIDAAKQFNSNGFSEGVKDFYEQMQGITKNVASLNAIYGVEIKDTLDDIRKVRKYFNNIDVVTNQLNESVEEVKMTKQQIGLLIKNLSSLNAIYGNMLGAIQSSVKI